MEHNYFCKVTKKKPTKKVFFQKNLVISDIFCTFAVPILEKNQKK